MSLLNDALRKKQREMRRPAAVAPGAIVPPASPRQRGRMLWIAGIGTTVLLAVGLGIGLTVLSIEAPATSVWPSSSASPAPQPAAREIIPSPNDEPSPTASPKDAPVIARDPEWRAAVGPTKDASAGQAEMKIRLPQPSPAASPTTVATTPQVDSKAEEAFHRPSPSVPSEDPGGDVATDPPLAERYFRKALSYHAQGRLPKAIAFYRDVLQLQPDHFDARFNLASAYIESGAFEDAHRIAQALYRRDPASPQVLTNLAITKIGLGQYRQALTLLDQAADTPHAETFTILLHKGIACRGLHQLDAALAWYHKAEDLNPDHPQLLFNLALAYDRRQAFDQALHYYQAYRKVVSDGQDRVPSGIQQRIAALRSYLARHSQESRKP